MMRRLLATVLVSITALLLGQPASATVTFTEHQKRQTDTFVDFIPCVEARARITLTYNAVFHITAAGFDAQGHPIPPFHVTGTSTGRFVADPIPRSVPTYRGHFTQWFGENHNRQNENGTFTFTVIGKGEDGSKLKFHVTAHFSVNANGDVTSEFEKVRCR